MPDELPQEAYGRLYLVDGDIFIRLVGLVNTAGAKNHSFHAQSLQEGRLGSKGHCFRRVAGQLFCQVDQFGRPGFFEGFDAAKQFGQ